MKTILIIVIVIAILALSLWFTKAVFESDLPNWFKWWLVR